MDKEGLIPWRPASAKLAESTAKQRRVDSILKRFVEEQERQERARDEHFKRQIHASLQMRDRQRVLIYQAFQKRLEQRRLKELYDYSMFSSLRDSWNDLEQQDFMIGVGAMQKALTRHALDIEEDSFNVQEEIEAFEGKGYELGAEIVAAIGMKQNERVTDKRKDKRKESIVIKDSTKKATKSDGISNATILLQEYFEQQEKEKEIEENLKKAEEEEYLKKQHEAALQLEAAQAEEEALIQQRMLLEQEIAEQRAQEWEAVLARDRELLLMMREDCAKEISHEKKLWQEEKKMKMEKRKTKHINMCSELILQITSLAESVAWYKECTNCVLPNFDWREWKNLFIKGIICPYSLHNSQSHNNLLSVADGPLFDKTMIMEYLQEEGEWKGVEEIGKNKDLGKILSEILDIACSPPKPLLDSVLSKLKLKLAVVGAPFSGKTSLARKMEDRFGIARIDVKDLISNAIWAVDADETQTTEDVNAKVDLGLEQEQVQPPIASQKVVLGKEAKSALQQGLQIPDATMVELFMLTVNCLGGQDSSIASQKSVLQGKAIPSIQDAEKKNKTGTTLSAQRNDKKKTLDIDDDMENSEYMPGFILDGFPNTVEQAEILEKALTGFDMKDVALKWSRTSLVAPPPELEQEHKFSSGFDGIFIIEPLDEMEALKRAVAKHVDPKTGITYNLEFDPPPQTDKTGIASRLVPLEEVGLARKRITEGTINWTSFLEWMNKFVSICFIGRDEHNNVNFSDALSIADGFLDARAKAAAAENAAKAAIAANEAANRALHDAERASLEASDAAKQLFLAKVAELEASAVLDRTSNNSVAKDLLKVKASELANQKLQDATAALKEAEDAAETAKMAALEAQNAAETAQNSITEARTSIQAKAATRKSAEMAKAAALSANAAYQKAERALKTAALSISDANGSLVTANTSCTENNITTLIPDKVDAINDSWNTITSSCCDSSHVPLDSGVAGIRYQQWEDIENKYLECLKQAMKTLREERFNTCNILREIKEAFLQFLQQNDDKQQIFDNFQGKYNRVDASTRQTMKMKKQLQQQAEELDRKLHSACESHLKAAAENINSCLNDWINQRTQTISSIFIPFIQIELDRYVGTCCFLHEHFFGKNGLNSDNFNALRNVMEPITSSKSTPLPGWVSNIGLALPQLLQVLVKALTVADVVMKEINDQQRDRAASHPDAKTLSKISKKTIAKKDVDSLDAMSTIPPAILREREILESRFQLLASKACSCLKELELLLKSTHQQMETWRSKYNDVELNVVKEVVEITKEAIEEGIPLWYHMHLSREELIIDQSDLVMDPQSMGQESLADLNTWHKEVLESLISIFQQKYPKGYILREDVTSTIRGEVQRVHTACKNDFSISMVPRVPGTKQRPGGPFEIWVEYVEMLIKESPKDTSIEKRRLIDWRSLLISLMDVHYDHFISMSTLKDVLEARTLLEEASKEIKGNINLEKFLGTKLWFDTDTLDRGLNSCEGVKKIIYTMLQCEDNGIPWQQIMLYLCLDEDPTIALQKVFCVFTSSLPEDSFLKPGDIIQALYPSGQDGALEAGFMIWSLDDLKDMIQKAQEERSANSPRTYEESWSEEAQASESDSMANQRGSTITDKHASIVQEASDLCDRALEAFVEAYSEAKKRGSLDDFELDEQAATIIQEFLDRFVYESNNRDLQKTKTSNLDADSATADMLSLQDLLCSSATTNLRAALQARYGNKSLHLMI